MPVRHVCTLAVIPLAWIILAACQYDKPVHTHGLNLSETQRNHLQSRAAGTDAGAAWRLYGYYAFELHDETAAEPWLRRAAKLKHPEAQRLLAYFIKDYHRTPVGFGPNESAAVKSLLAQSAQTRGDACYDLASAYAEGYFGARNPSKARAFFQRGARLNNRMCWEELAHYCRHGLGGPRDDAEAYYWISLEAGCVDPRSVSGEKTWRVREEIASNLALPVLEREWKRIDAFMTQVTARRITLDSAPFLSGMINPRLEAEGRRLAKQREDEHRNRCKSKNA